MIFRHIRLRKLKRVDCELSLETALALADLLVRMASCAGVSDEDGLGRGEGALLRAAVGKGVEEVAAEEGVGCACAHGGLGWGEMGM